MISRQWLRVEPNVTQQQKCGNLSSEIAKIVFLSDWFILDTPARVHGLEIVGLPDPDGKPSRPGLQYLVTLNHTIRFHLTTGFKADEWLFVEARTPWASKGRVLAEASMFTKQGLLIATYTQEVCKKSNQS